MPDRGLLNVTLKLPDGLSRDALQAAASGGFYAGLALGVIAGVLLMVIINQAYIFRRLPK